MKIKDFFFIYCIKSIAAFALLGLWYGTQFLLYVSKSKMGGISFDRGHDLLSPLNDFFQHHDKIADAVLIVTSADIDISLICLFFWGIFGNTFRPTISALLVLIFRQISQLLVSEPIPTGMIWHYPGFPSLVVIPFPKNKFIIQPNF